MHDREVTTTTLMIDKALKCARPGTTMQPDAARFLPAPELRAMGYKRMGTPSTARPELYFELLGIIRVPPCVQRLLSSLLLYLLASPLVNSPMGKRCPKSTKRSALIRL